MKTSTASGMSRRTCAAPCQSISSSTSCPARPARAATSPTSRTSCRARTRARGTRRAALQRHEARLVDEMIVDAVVLAGARRRASYRTPTAGCRARVRAARRRGSSCRRRTARRARTGSPRRGGPWWRRAGGGLPVGPVRMLLVGACVDGRRPPAAARVARASASRRVRSHRGAGPCRRSLATQGSAPARASARSAP